MWFFGAVQGVSFAVERNYCEIIAESDDFLSTCYRESLILSRPRCLLWVADLFNKQ